jgi:hypothetical protein
LAHTILLGHFDDSSVATRQAVPTTYRKHANQIGGTVVTPILITGQLAPQIKTRIARSQRERRSS